MPLRKMRQKKFRGIYEYYKASDHDKATTAYYINVRDADGTARKVKTDAITPEEAVIALAHYKATRKQSVVIQNHKLTFSDLAEQYFSQRTTSNNSKDKRRFELYAEPVLGKIRIIKITKRDVQNLQSQLKTKLIRSSPKKDAEAITLAPRTINNVVDITLGILQWAYNQELIPNPLPRIDKLKLDNERQRVFTQEELDTLFSNTEGSTRIFLLLAYYTAQRPLSVLRLKKKHILNDSVLIESIKHQTSHRVPIATKLRDELLPWIDLLDPEDYVVSQGSVPMPYHTMSGRLSKLFTKLFNQGLNYRTDTKMWASMYTLRHTALTNIYANTSDIYAAQSIANHSSIKMTQRYAKHSEKLKRNAVEGL